jgi:hypothetical protein
MAMQSEHLSNLHVGWTVGGWLVSAAVTAAAYLAGVGMGLVQQGPGAGIWIALSMACGFFAGGAVVGMRWGDAPVIHGAAITFFSILVWFVVSLLGGEGPLDSVQLVLGLVLLQFVSASAGAGVGRRAFGGSNGG